MCITENSRQLSIHCYYWRFILPSTALYLLTQSWVSLILYKIVTIFFAIQYISDFKLLNTLNSRKPCICVCLLVHVSEWKGGAYLLNTGIILQFWDLKIEFRHYIQNKSMSLTVASLQKKQM